MTHVFMEDAREIKIPWRDRVIDLSAWADDAFGIYDYTSVNNAMVVEFELRPVIRAVAIVIRSISGRPPALMLPAVHVVGHELHLLTADAVWPRTVPAALLALIVWVEHIASRDSGRH